MTNPTLNGDLPSSIQERFPNARIRPGSHVEDCCSEFAAQPDGSVLLTCEIRYVEDDKANKLKHLFRLVDGDVHEVLSNGISLPVWEHFRQAGKNLRVKRGETFVDVVCDHAKAWL